MSDLSITNALLLQNADVNTVEERSCVICFEELSTKKNFCVTECGHEFCFSCMMKHMQRNNGCPLCRQQIIEDISDSDSEESEYTEYDEEDDVTVEDAETEEEETETEYPIESFVAAFEAKGYGLKDALSMLMYRYSKTDDKYTKTYIKQLEDDVEDMNDELQKEFDERVRMSEEDVRV